MAPGAGEVVRGASGAGLAGGAGRRWSWSGRAIRSGEPQVGGQPLAVGEQALHRRRVGRRVPVGHLGDPVIDELDEAGAWLGRQVFGAKEV
jgi:hypothetical protein